MEVVIEMARRSDYPLSFVDKMHDAFIRSLQHQGVADAWGLPMVDVETVLEAVTA